MSEIKFLVNHLGKPSNPYNKITGSLSVCLCVLALGRFITILWEGTTNFPREIEKNITIPI